MSIDLTSRAMLVSLKVSQWSGRKLDKRVTAEVNAQHGAASDAGRYNKVLVARDALASIQTIVGAARADHARLSLPWMQDGTRILPADGFTRYAETMRLHREAYETAVSEFVDAFPSYVDHARAMLNGMFDAADYPDPSDLATRFRWSVKVLPMPDAADFRVDIADDVASDLRAEIEATMRDATQDAMRDAWDRLHNVASAMAEKLASYQPATADHKATGIFRDSLVENVRDLVDILPGLNLTGDAQLSAMIERARDTLTTHDAATLRGDDVAREETRQAAADIADAMGAFMGAPMADAA